MQQHHKKKKKEKKENIHETSVRKQHSACDNE